METKIFALNPQDFSPEDLSGAAELIQKGGLVAFPTETVYGLGADAENPEGAKAIYKAKGRPSDNPLIVHIASEDDLEKVAREVPESARKLARAFWPGPLTMILKKSSRIPTETTGGLDTVAIRFPSHPIAKALILKSNKWIAAPSANTSGRPSPTAAEHVIEDLSGKVDMIVDGGRVDIGLESTIVDLTEEVPVILRPGFITPEDIRSVLGQVEIDPGLSLGSAQRPKAPGMKYRHYAPKAALTIYEGDQKNVVSEISRSIQQEAVQGHKVAVLCLKEHEALYKQAFCDACDSGAITGNAARDTVKNPGALITFPLGDESHENAVAHNLFDALRKCDSEQADRIFSESFYSDGLGLAIMNRLLKAAGHDIRKI